MPEKKIYELDFEEYIKTSEPAKKEKTYAWSTAIGLQQVDGLTPSKYLYETAKQNIEGNITFEQAKSIIDSYYESKIDRTSNDDERTEEADKVASRIAQILSEKSFNFSPSHLIAIHGRLFDGIFKSAGTIRDYDITKKEWVLNGDTVIYGAAFELKAALDYDFEQERNFNYKDLSMEEIVKHITFFASRLWQIHAFGEGNTNTKVKSSDKVAINQKSSDKILEYLKKEGSISSSIAMSITGLSSAGVRKILSKFTETGIIKPEGANRNRIYIFAGNEKK